MAQESNICLQFVTGFVSQHLQRQPPAMLICVCILKAHNCIQPVLLQRSSVVTCANCSTVQQNSDIMSTFLWRRKGRYVQAMSSAFHEKSCLSNIRRNLFCLQTWCPFDGSEFAMHLHGFKIKSFVISDFIKSRLTKWTRIVKKNR